VAMVSVEERRHDHICVERREQFLDASEQIDGALHERLHMANLSD
jgi:hypothetical protein